MILLVTWVIVIYWLSQLTTTITTPVYVHDMQHKTSVAPFTNINCSLDKQSPAQETVEWNYLSIPKLQRIHRWSLGIDR